jgi:RNA polymerase sigma-70 factor, ECF subfamily
MTSSNSDVRAFAAHFSGDVPPSLRPVGPAVTETNEEPRPACAEAAWPELVRRVQAGDPTAMEDLYRVFSARIRFHLWRQVGAQDMADRLHDIFVIVTDSIRRGELRDPERLMGYLRTVVRRQIAGHLHGVREQRQKWCSLEFGPALPDRRPSAEHGVIHRQHRDLARRIIAAMRDRDREVLLRFYVHEQEPQQICRDMELSETQFRLLKSRAKARLTTLCRGTLARA